MALDTLSSSELINLIILETFSATQFNCNAISSEDKILLGNNSNVPKQESQEGLNNSLCEMPIVDNHFGTERGKTEKNMGVDEGGKKKRRRRQKVCKNKEDAENQRRTHIFVERNRRKQMNEHLAVLRSLMPQSYVQRGDQASIVGGAIEFVKKLEHTLQSLESQKLQLQKQGIITGPRADETCNFTTTTTTTTSTANSTTTTTMPETTPFARFSSYPQYTCSQSPQKLLTSSKSQGAIGDIEVTLIETHANIRIISQRRVRQLSKLVAAFQTLYMTILHLNVTTLDPLVLYSISAKVEEGCQFGSANDIANAINHILRLIKEEATLFC